FGYRPALPAAVAGEHATAELVRDRFSTLWDVRVRARISAIDPTEPVPELDAAFARAFRGTDPSRLSELFTAVARAELGTFDDLMGCALHGGAITGAVDAGAERR